MISIESQKQRLKARDPAGLWKNGFALCTPLEVERGGDVTAQDNAGGDITNASGALCAARIAAGSEAQDNEAPFRSHGQERKHKRPQAQDQECRGQAQDATRPLESVSPGLANGYC